MMQDTLQTEHHMNKKTLNVAAKDGHCLAATIIEPSKVIKGHIHILHGMAEHQGRYLGFAEKLADTGYLVSMHDHRGHGKTAELNHEVKGFFSEKNGFEHVVEDVKTVTDEIRTQYELPKMILFGHSMGSFVARRYSELYSEELCKAIYCGTGSVGVQHYAGANLAKGLAAGKGKREESKLLNQLSFGLFNNKINQPKTAVDWLTRDEAEIKKYLADDDCGFISTNQFFVDLLGGIITLSKRAEVARIRKDLPILLISGSKDPVGGFEKGVWRVARQLSRAGLQDITVQLFAEMRHEILNEINNDFVIQTILNWLEKKECNKKI